jgi:hypothetical protein
MIRRFYEKLEWLLKVCGWWNSVACPVYESIAVFSRWIRAGSVAQCGPVAGGNHRSQCHVYAYTRSNFDAYASQSIIAANDYWSEDDIKDGARRDTVNVLRTIQTSGTTLPFQAVAVTVTFSMRDVYGNTEESNIVVATYDREILAKVNWTGFSVDNVYRIANQDNLFVHK